MSDDNFGEELPYDMQGFQTEEFDLGSEDAAGDWLTQHSSSGLGSERTAVSPALMLGRIDAMEHPTQLVAKMALMGTLDARSVGMDHIDVEAAVEEFTSVTGMSRFDMGRQIKIPDGVELPRSRERLRMGVSLLATSGEYMDIGPGGRLIGQSLNADRTDKADKALKEAFAGIDGLADRYFTKSTREGPLYQRRHKQLVGELTHWILDKGSSWSANAFLPLPNQLNTEGLIPTQAEGFRQGAGSTSPYTPLQHGEELYAQRAQGDVSVYAQGNLAASAPSLRNTFAPWDNSLENPGKTRDFNFNQLRTGVEGIRKTLRGFALSTRDEYKGNKERVLGLDNVSGDQAAFYDRVNDSATFTDMGGLSTYRNLAVDGDKSESDIYLREGVDLEAVPDRLSAPNGEISDRDLYRLYMEDAKNPVQGSDAWLAQRKGMVTGSKSKELWKGKGDARLAITMAAERLGVADDVANAYTSQGNKYEDRVKRSFLAGPGKNLDWEEAFFETNESMPGFGASPDGRLYDKTTGKSAGLLELKYFGESTFKDALKDTMPQMQMQMMVTGESQTHLYALNRETGEYSHDIVKANPTMQSELKSLGESALRLTSGLDVRGIKEMRKYVKGARRPGAGAGQTSSFTSTGTEVSAPMTAFGSQVALRDSSPAVVSNTDDVVDSLEDIFNQLGGGGGDGGSEDSMNKFTEAVDNATKSLGLMAAGAIVSGNESGMNEVRRADLIGLDVMNMRGMRKVLESSGMDSDGINSTLGGAGDLVAAYNSEISAVDTWSNLKVMQASAVTMPGIRGLKIPSLRDMQSLDPQGMTAMVKGMMNGVSSKQAKSFIANKMFPGMGDLVGSSASAEDIGSAIDTSISEEDLRDTYSGVQDVAQLLRDFKEGLGSLGSEVGSLGKGITVLAGTVGTLATAYAMTKGKLNMGGAGGKLGGLLGGAAALTGLAVIAEPVIEQYTAGQATAAIAEEGLAGQEDLDLNLNIPNAFGAGNGTYSTIPGKSIGGVVTPERNHATKQTIVNNLEVTVGISPDLTVVETDFNGDINTDETSNIN